MDRQEPARTIGVGGMKSKVDNVMQKQSREMEMMLKGYGLTTAQILYHLPDHPHLLQTYIWQEYDLAPRFPILFGFIEFWQSTLEGALHSVQYSHKRLIGPNEWRNVDGEIVLH
jgi:uncharacterized protein Usg